ncbi:Rubredoxin-1 [Porphyridium purpureum]|uniref:Rubredoxin-1 n=1 Tax=Porphyridium purpureum TaxID=35688 RepID=A0A5J4YRV6_PORPP|nr:Rubredoxin-1 [Porphyridium purpureum]|eukprot:POR7142..scf236_6
MAFVSGASAAVRVGGQCAPAVDRSAGARRAVAAGRTTVRMAAGKEEIWKGEWLCVDCGYEYKRGQNVAFESLPDDWRCPQCRAPKRRFAKKAGDKVQEAGTTSNAPIVILSLVGLVGVLVFAVWAVNNL